MALSCVVSFEVTTLVIEVGERAGEVAGGYGWEQIGSRLLTSSCFNKVVAGGTGKRCSGRAFAMP
jgi:hypothetical protein